MAEDYSTIVTVSGARISLLDPQISEIDVHDVAHALSMQCRFNGHTREFYSVAQHSLLVSSLCEGIDGQMFGLLHDAHEAYMGDLVSPLKRLLGGDLLVHDPLADFSRFEKLLSARTLQALFPERFSNLAWLRGTGSQQVWRHVHAADRMALAIEVRDVLAAGIGPEPTALPTPRKDVHIVCQGPTWARDAFLERYLGLYAQFKQQFPREQPTS